MSRDKTTEEEPDEELGAEPDGEFDGDGPDEDFEDEPDGEEDAPEDNGPDADDDEEDDEDGPKPARAGTVEDDDDPDPDDVEAELDAILKERLAAGDDDEEEDEDGSDPKMPVSPESVEERQETELHCPHCFLLVQASAVAETGECGHCGGPIKCPAHPADRGVGEGGDPSRRFRPRHLVRDGPGGDGPQAWW